jgi:uncharacterized RDD family membrane protein YckC
VTCHYCRAQNDNDNHRCSRCGRRTQDRTPVQMTAAVPDLETVEMPSPAPAPLRPQLVTSPSPKRAEVGAQPAYQASLFGPMVASPAQAELPAGTSRRSTPRARRDYSRQQRLDFEETRTHSTQREVSAYSGAPVAVAAHRLMAAAVDGTLAITALAVFVGTFHFFMGVEVVFSKQMLPVYVAAAGCISLFYRVLFCIANIDTPGIRWTGLCVIDFDGRTPTRKQRWFRLLGGHVGSIAAGIGLAWAMFDEERLTWHDHMSKTFPTPRFF